MVRLQDLGYIREQSVKELKEYLNRLFTPELKWCYQDVLPLPGVDDIKPQQDKVLLVISQPHQDGLHPDLKRFYEGTTYQNRILFLTGQRNFDSLLESAKKHKAIQQIVQEMERERIPSNDPQMVQGLELKDKLQGQFLMAVKETFNTIQYPTKNGLASAEFLMKFTGNEYKGETQIIETLKEAQKYTEDIESETFLKKVDSRLFTQNPMPWTDIKKRAATSPTWQWHRTDALEHLKTNCIRKEVWREDGGGYILKGPFPRPATNLTIQVLSRDDNSGTVKLRLNPVNADTLYAEVGATATTASQKLEDRVYEASELEVSFLAVDSKGEHQTGDAVTWKNSITLKSRAYRTGSDMMVELKAAPDVPIRYTTDGSNPKNSGGTYEGVFPVSEGTLVVQAYAESKGIVSDVHTLQIPWGQKPFQPDLVKPAEWQKAHELSSSAEAYSFIDRLKKYKTLVAGSSVMVNQNDKNWIEVNFGENVSLSPERLETIVNEFRDMLENAAVSIRADRLKFENGQSLMDFAGEEQINPAQDEVIQ